MKKFGALSAVLIVMIVFTSINSFSQQSNKDMLQKQSVKTVALDELLAGTYTFTYSTGTYTDLMGGTNISAGMTWDDPQLACPIGFDFKLFGVAFDTAWVSDPWEVGFGTDIGDGFDYYFTPYGADLLDRSFGDGTNKPKSPISYLLVDTAPNRILKIEWRNAGYLEEIMDTNITKKTNFINLQLWLYETTNNIEIHWGAHNVTIPEIIYAGETGPYIGLNNDIALKYYTLTGDSTKPKITPQPFGFINGTPPNGMIYKFDAGYINSIADQKSNIYSVYPNPVRDVLQIRMPDNRERLIITIFNMQGKEIMTSQFSNTNHVHLNVNALDQGIYLLKIQDAESTQTLKFTKR
jgi:hypothetical protein